MSTFKKQSFPVQLNKNYENYFHINNAEKQNYQKEPFKNFQQVSLFPS